MIKGEDPWDKRTEVWKRRAYERISSYTYSGYENVLPLTREVLENADKDLRIRALKALDRRATKDSIPLICLSLTEDPDEDVRWEALKSLWFYEIDETAAKALVKAIGDEDEFIAQEALDTLGRKKVKEAVPLLIEILRERRHKEYAPFIALVLGEIGDEKALPVLQDILKDEDYIKLQERESVIWAIKKIKGEIKTSLYDSKIVIKRGFKFDGQKYAREYEEILVVPPPKK
jgi:HEAT repeat protein